MAAHQRRVRTGVSRSLTQGQSPRDQDFQLELADGLGYDYAWEVEHHFLEEYSHSSAPEVFLAAASQRTKQIRLAHGIIQLTTNHPARVAERVSTLDLVSRGRVELGIGEGASTIELHPFDRRFRDKREVWEEAIRQSEGWTFFQFALRFYATQGAPTVPGSVDLWQGYLKWKDTPPGRKVHGTGLIGSPDTIREKLRRFAESNIDQVILLNQAGKNSHEDICSSLEIFARKVMPEFHDHEPAHQEWKKAVLSGDLVLSDLSTAERSYRRATLQKDASGNTAH